MLPLSGLYHKVNTKAKKPVRKKSLLVIRAIHLCLSRLLSKLLSKFRKFFKIHIHSTPSVLLPNSMLPEEQDEEKTRGSSTSMRETSSSTSMTESSSSITDSSSTDEQGALDLVRGWVLVTYKMVKIGCYDSFVKH